MIRDTDLNRRSFLRYAGTATGAAATVSMAGCVGGDDDDDDNGVDNGDDDNGVDNGDDDPTESDEDFHVTVTQGAFANSMNPMGDSSTPGWNVIEQAYERILFFSKDDGEPIARVADGWERIDNTTIELTVRDGVTFHSGNECTAEDVAFSINYAINPEVSGVVPSIGDVDEAEAVDDETVRVHLNAVVPTIFRNFASMARVIERDWVEGDGDINQDANGTGPFELVEYEEGQYVEYEKFDDYWGEEPAVDTARFDVRTEDGARIESMFAGETDIISAVPPDRVADIEGEDGQKARTVPSVRSVFLVMNESDEPFDSVEFRRAMNYAVDTEAVIDSQLGGFGNRTSQPALPGHFGHDPDLDPYPYDPDKAEDLVDQSGYAGADITLEVPSGRYVGGVATAESYAGQIDELDNVSCDIQRREFAEFIGEMSAGDAVFFLIGFAVPTLDTNDAMFYWFLGPPGTANDEEINNLLTEADNTADPGEREPLLQEANRRAHEQAYWVFSHQQFSIYGVSEDIEWEPRKDEAIRLEEMFPA